TPASQPTPSGSNSGEQVVRIIVDSKSGGRGAFSRLLSIVFFFSIFLNIILLSANSVEFSTSDSLLEKHHSGTEGAKDKIVLLNVFATIMPPFTERLLDQIDQAIEDDDIKGAVIVVDSPGGLVADSHQIYTKLTELSKLKPVYVSMKRIAASGGYYVAMGAGKEGRIYAEPTTWTGSIGVIIPHYNVVDLAEKIGMKSEPLTTGEFKDSLSSFKEISVRDREVWDGILDDAYQRFLDVIASGRPNMNRKEIESVATGRIFTASQAKEEGLVDEIAYLDKVIDDLQAKLGIDEVDVIEYGYVPTLTEILIGSVEARSEHSLLKELINSPAPRAFYLMGSRQ
ncbi:MAG: signal peptide peptidase SppA, partial [Planctomycetaceae bacterium]|nr:signal peptide peptidase SppA [Planctomycetaceae bacterium]